jgi:AmmeMemoRadiSam system protein B
VAGTFYPGDAGQCRRVARKLLDEAASALASRGSDAGTARPWLGGIVPHAGWMCSGAIAARTIAAIAASTPQPPDVVVVFGAIHTAGAEVDFAALDANEAWAVPGGQTELLGDVARQFCDSSPALFAVEERLHRREHAIEVELPLIQGAWPAAALLPIEVPPADDAAEMGRRVAEHVSSAGLRAVYLASSDLTHYGPSYRFTPAGVGPEALEWAKANDRRVLERVTDLAAECVVPEVRLHANACGAGAIAAMLSACRALGASSARVLRHANSYETLAEVAPQPPTNAVGYASVVVG